MALTLLYSTPHEPISLDEAKSWLRVEHTGDDADIEALIVAARAMVEERTWRQLLTADYRLTLDAFPTACGSGREYDEIRLPKPPLLRLVKFQYLDGSGVTQDVDSAIYRIETGEEARLILRNGQSWPTALVEKNAVTVEYQAGYGTAADAVPSQLRLAIRMLVCHWYENRGPVLKGTIRQEVPWTVDALLDPFRAFEFA